MDIHSKLGDLQFVWDDNKALANISRHGVLFEEAREVFFDRLARFVDAGTPEEDRQGIVGVTFREALLYVVHVEWGDYTIRIISARLAERSERRQFELD